MENLKKFYIGSQWDTPISKVTMPVVNPATEKQIATVAMGKAADDDKDVGRAKMAIEGF